MKKDETDKDNIGWTTTQTFIQGEKVMIRRLGDGMEYRAKIAGIAIGGSTKVMIIEIVDKFRDDLYPFSHANITEVCIDKESWD